MPYLNIKLSSQPSEEMSRRVASALTGLTGELLNKKREVTAVAVDFLDAARWFVAGTSLAELGKHTFYLEIKITKGTNTKREKAAYLAEVFKALEGILGPLHPASYAVIQEVDADGWGYGGQTQEHRFIAGQMQ
jgi:4-oxalocrotonate tautomerase